VLFLKSMSEVCAQTGWSVHASVLMGNRKVALGKLVREGRGVLRMASSQAENAERSEREPDVEKNGMEELDEEAARMLAEYIVEKTNE
jgi:hypothetical protein